MNEQLIEIRIKAERKQAYTNGVITGICICIATTIVMFGVFFIII